MKRGKKTLVVCGLPGAGKTTLVREYKKKQIRTLDLDNAILKTSGYSSIDTLVDKKSWSYFRSLEFQIFVQNLEKVQILSLGGGTLDRVSYTSLFVSQCTLVFLDTPIKTCIDRLYSNKHLLVQKLPKNGLEELLRYRRSRFLKFNSVHLQKNKTDLLTELLHSNCLI